MTWLLAIFGNLIAMIIWHWRRQISTVTGRTLNLIATGLFLAGTAFVNWGDTNLVPYTI